MTVKEATPVKCKFNITNHYITAQVVGRLIMDGIYAPVNSKVYRNNCEITRPRYSKHILPVPLPFVISRFQCGAFSLPRGWLSISSDLPNLIINEECHILHIPWVFTLSLCCLRKKYSIIQLKAFMKNNVPTNAGH